MRKYLFLNTTSIHINLATEEYLFLKNLSHPLLLLYTNSPSVVLGRYQNIYEELNIREVENQTIPVARRISGGGTVFHDLGNLNYSYIMPLKEKYIPDYDSFLLPVINTLRKIGIPAHKQRGSDIAVEGKKISGSAQKSNKNTIMHHGTLLFSSDLEQLELMLKSPKGNFVSKSVKSFRSEVCNIRDYLPKDKNLDIKWLAAELIKDMAGAKAERLCLEPEDFNEIKKLSKKYQSWEWNWGQSPKFSIDEDIFSIKIEDGIISDWVFTPLDDRAWDSQRSLIAKDYKISDDLLCKCAANLTEKKFTYAVLTSELRELGDLGEKLMDILF